jgi:alpha-mannosidase
MLSARVVLLAPLPQCNSFLAVDQENSIVSAIKRAEDNDDVIVRCYETNRVMTTATIRLIAWDRTFTTTFAPCEIKTLRIPPDASAAITETDLVEWE